MNSRKKLTAILLSILALSAIGTSREARADYFNQSPKEQVLDFLLNPGLGYGLAYFCGRYADPRSVMGERCGQASHKLFDLLDCSSAVGPTGHIHVVCFQQSLNQLLRRQDGVQFLEAAYEFIHEAAMKRRPANLWNWTVEYFRGDEEKALRWISIFLQDTSKEYPNMLAKLSDNWDRKSRKPLQVFEKLLALVAGVGNSDLPPPGRLPPTFNLYPEGVTVGDRRMYHFYVPAYLTRRLLALAPAHSPDETMAWFVPFIFNTTYEYARINIEANGMGIHMLDEPQSIDPKKGSNSETMLAIHLGYAGARWAAGVPERDIMDHQVFVKAFQADPNSFIRNVMYRDLKPVPFDPYWLPGNAFIPLN
ncbi:hypothetical protein K2X30_09605 [bacterium]|nr:hypothetical protein [bacterium]